MNISAAGHLRAAGLLPSLNLGIFPNRLDEPALSYSLELLALILLLEDLGM